MVKAIPQIVSGLVDAIIGNIDKIIMAGVQLFVALIENLPTIIVEIVKAIPQIITGIVEAIGSLAWKLVEAGGNLIKGLWEGISNAADWIWGKIKGFFSGIVDGIKNFFGIRSPSTLFAGLGRNMGEGIGVGFEDAMDTSRFLGAVPAAAQATYNAKPRFLITTGTELDGQAQQVCVKIGAAEWQDSVNNPERFSQGGYLGNGVKTVFRSDDVLSPGSVTAVFRCLDEGIGSSSSEVNCAFTVLASPFQTIAENETKVKVEHIRTIREAVNAVRGYYGLAAANWSENIVAGKTAIKNWPYHILEIRSVLEGVVDFINQFDVVLAFDVPEVDWLPIGTGRPSAAVMRQIQNLILSL